LSQNDAEEHKSMKKIILSLKVGLVAATAILLSSRAEALTLNFSEVGGALIVFNGDSNSFTFAPTAPAAQFSITSVVDGVSAGTVNDTGSMSGVFTLGSITSPAAGLEVAPVNGAGVLTINDGAGQSLTANLTFGTISSFGTGGTINLQGAVNLTNIQYVGTDVNYLAFAAANNGIETITFQFTSPTSLTQLTADGTTTSTSFSGSITAAATSVPDGGATAVLLGLSLLGVAAVRRKIASSSKSA
jgi:hypothetical protein